MNTIMKIEILIMKKNRQSMIENHGITIIRTNPDDEDFNINKLINQMYRHISQSNKLKLKKEQAKIKKTRR